MTTRSILKSALAGVCFQALVVLASGPASAADIAQSQPSYAGQARVWFLRVFDPTLSLEMAAIYANGVLVGESRAGSAFTVDLAPGTYTFTVASVANASQTPIVQLTAGTQVYFNVDTGDWVGAGDQEQDHGRGTFGLRQVSAPLAINTSSR